jgi:hypothetical protein
MKVFRTHDKKSLEMRIDSDLHVYDWENFLSVLVEKYKPVWFIYTTNWLKKH